MQADLRGFSPAEVVAGKSDRIKSGLFRTGEKPASAGGRLGSDRPIA